MTQRHTHRHGMRLGALALGVFAAFVVIVGCGGDDPTAAPEPTAAPTSAPAATATTAPTEPDDSMMMAEQSGKLIVAQEAIGAGWFTSSPYDDYTSDQMGVADPLLYADWAEIPQRGSFNPAISIATNWEVASDSSSITFDLRELRPSLRQLWPEPCDSAP